MSRRYIVKQRARIDTITGPVNLPYGTEVEAVGDYLTHQGNRLCAVTSRKAHLYFAPDDDGQGRERGALTMAITGAGIWRGRIPCARNTGTWSMRITSYGGTHFTRPRWRICGTLPP